MLQVKAPAHSLSLQSQGAFVLRFPWVKGYCEKQDSILQWEQTFN